MLTWIPGVDVTLNTLYDNLSFDCTGGTATSSYHRQWLPIIGQMLRDLAWGQVRPVAINEVAAEFATEDQNGTCGGFDQMICTAGADGIHPEEEGYEVIVEKLWEAAGGVNLGSRDELNRAAINDVDYGFLRRVRRSSSRCWLAAACKQMSCLVSAQSIPMKAVKSVSVEDFIGHLPKC